MVASSGGSQVVVPQLSTPLVQQDSLIVANPWARFFIDLWKKTGGSFISTANAVFLGQNASAIDAYDSQGNILGQVAILAEEPEQPLTVGTSPFEFTATVAGMVLVSEGQVQFKRGSGNFRTLGLTGGSIFMVAGDSIQVSWYGATGPEVFFYPSFAS